MVRFWMSPPSTLTPDELGEVAAHLATCEVHLEEAVARMDVALGAEEVEVVLREDVRHAVPVEDYFDLALETWDLDGVVGLLLLGSGVQAREKQTAGTIAMRQLRMLMSDLQLLRLFFFWRIRRRRRVRGRVRKVLTSNPASMPQRTSNEKRLLREPASCHKGAERPAKRRDVGAKSDRCGSRGWKKNNNCFF